MVHLNIVLFVLAIKTPVHIQSYADAGTRVPRNVNSIRFLVSVNDTWGPCIATVATPPLKPGVKHNFTEAIHVADCDHVKIKSHENGLVYMEFNQIHYSTSKSTKDAKLKTQVYAAVDLVFHSSVIEDASPPTCHIPWNGTYLVPSPKNMDMSLLPGCFTGDSREGYHMTYYWFYILDWTFG
ncbi:hypothetical protein KUTeg_018256 [Tegillarca granosa]|uniref:Uncharacterized protein n=1 Tax=Tegillarca granosa TaxID=220873 RepID=A0ABQ9EHB4_TEGGR|nr:hypothetical protein KUTeg_018256 [Tegillarca granosa]